MKYDRKFASRWRAKSPDALYAVSPLIHVGARAAQYKGNYLVEAADDICYQMMDIEDAHKLKILTTQETKELEITSFSLILSTLYRDIQ